MAHTTLVDRKFLDDITASGGDGKCHKRGCQQPLALGDRVYWPIWYDNIFHTENEPNCRTTDLPLHGRIRTTEEIEAAFVPAGPDLYAPYTRGNPGLGSEEDDY
jgi:hypothetical protein